jgi:hypothetical protein
MKLYAHSQDDALKAAGATWIVVTSRVTEGSFEHPRTAKVQVIVEPMTGIEPAYSAWEVDSTRLRGFVGVHRSGGRGREFGCDSHEFGHRSTSQSTTVSRVWTASLG